MAMTNGHSNGHSNGHNGHNGHSHYRQLSFAIELDPDPEPASRPCAKRLGHGSWCFLHDEHTGEHKGAPAEYGPVEASPPLLRQRHKGQV
jgi:hypothetical protein